MQLENVCRAAVKVLPCVPIESAQQKAFAMRIAVVRPLSCAEVKNARQTLCRAFLWLCRALPTHGKS
jgi:hypothetical protein